MNPLLAKLQPYPFERLRQLFADVRPNPEFAPISLGIGEPKHATPAFIKDALTSSLGALAAYPATAGTPALRESFTGWLHSRYGLALDLAGSFKEKPVDAYERLLMDVVKGNLTLFMRRDELDAAWRWIDPIREGWARHDERIKSYVAGSWGPAASSALVSRDGFAWQDES